MQRYLILCVSLLAIGCIEENPSEPLDTGVQGCVPGRTLACACPDGTMSSQVCLEDRTFGPCACGETPDAGGLEQDGAPFDECSPGDRDSADCANGIIERECDGNGHWGAWSDECVEAECEGDAHRARPCGPTHDGMQVQDCLEGRWQPWSECIYPTDCRNGATEEEACGLEGNGTRARRCVNNEWSAWEPCEDPDARCENDQVETADCGLNQRGMQTHTCVEQRWGSWTDCVDPDVCVDAAENARPCGLDMGGIEQQTCEAGQWSEWSRCVDPNACMGGTIDEEACGPNGRGSRIRRCQQGVWSDFSDCDDPDVCTDGEEVDEACGENGSRRRHCRLGHWSNWTACQNLCADGSPPPCDDVMCPVAAVVRDEMAVEPLDVIILDASPSAPADQLVRYEWTVVQRPDGSTAMPVEAFIDNQRPQNGGRDDDSSTPTALFFVDLAGDYTFALTVVDANDLAAPSAECPQPDVLVRVTARSLQAISVQLVWDTPADEDQADAQGTDLDLHFLHPAEGALWNARPFDCYFANPSPDWGPAGDAGNPSLDIDDTNGAGPENLSLEEPESLGRPYQVGVYYYRGGGLNMEGDWSSTATVRIFLRGEESAVFQRELEEQEFWVVAGILWDEDAGEIQAIDRVTPDIP